MKVLKKIFIFFLTSTLISLISILGISYNIKGIIIDGIVKDAIIENTDYNYLELSSDNEKINEILNSDGIKQIINKYTMITVNCIIEENKSCEVNIENDILNYFKENIEELKQITEISDEEIILNILRKEFEGNDLSKAIKDNIINTINNLKESEKLSLRIYNYIIKDSFRNIIVLLIIVNLILLCIIKKTIINILSNIGYSLFVTGIFYIILSYTIDNIVNEELGTNKFYTQQLFELGITIFIMGIIITLLHIIINKIIKIRKRVEE